MGKTVHTGRLLGIWKPELVKPGNKTKPYRKAIPGRVVSQRSLHRYSPTSSHLLVQNRGRIAFRQLLR